MHGQGLLLHIKLIHSDVCPVSRRRLFSFRPMRGRLFHVWLRALPWQLLQPCAPRLTAGQSKSVAAAGAKLRT